MVIIGKKPIREKHGIDVVAQVRASFWRRVDVKMEVQPPSHAMDEANSGSVLWAMMAVAAVRRGVDALCYVNGDVTLTWASQKPMSFQDLGLKTGDCVGVLQTAIGYDVDHFFPPECVLILRDTILRPFLDVFHRAIYGDKSAGVEHTMVWLYPGTRMGRVKLRHNVTTCRRMQQHCRDRQCVETTIGVEVAREGLQEAAST